MYAPKIYLKDVQSIKISFFRENNLFVKEKKDFYFNRLNKIKWGPDERSASDFVLYSYY